MILYGVTIVTSAFLLFLVQPIIAKQILPWFGGTAAVWTVCVVFFQAVLLAGYAYAHGLTRRSARTQSWAHIGLLLVSLACLPIIASSTWKPSPGSDPTWRIVGLLAATIGLPYFVLSSTGPLLQKWFAEDGAMQSRRASVYRLFALSNVGSLVGLLIYPFAIEPYATLRRQAWGWSAAYACFAVACIATAWRVGRRRQAAGGSVDDRSAAAIDAIDAIDAGDAVAPGPGRYLFWLSCGALGSMLLLALTNHITQNVASIPFLWVLPLALYLLSFVLVFEGRQGRGWYVRRWWLAPVLAAVIAMAWALSTNRGVLTLHAALPIYLIGLFLACVFCHGELAAMKPAPAWLTHFYLSLSAGGAIGGLFVALVAPKIFDNYWETPIALFGVCVVAAITLRRQSLRDWPVCLLLGGVASMLVLFAGGGAPFEAARNTLFGAKSASAIAPLVVAAVLLWALAFRKRWPLAVVVTGLACTGFYAQSYYRFLSRDTLQASRNFYGALRVKDIGVGRDRTRDLMHGVIVHGDQFLERDRRTATTYYGATSGIGLALQQLRVGDTSLDVGMIGLGAGTLTAWGKPGDHYRIYELNPAVVAIAERDFTYLADTGASVSIALGDARLSMEREVADGSAMPFDVIAVDAFSSDAIPVHLITREALDVYLRHLKPDGIVAFHVSNRFLRLAPVVAQLAHDAGLIAANVDDEAKDAGALDSDWVLVTRNQAFLDRPAVRARISKIEPIPGLPMWTDQFNNLFKILK